MLSTRVGIGFRRENVAELLERRPTELDCLEVAPENFMNTGGKLYRSFRELAEIYPVVFHGISLSIGSLQPLDWDFLRQVRDFVRQFGGRWMSDHLCYSSVMGAQFHDLLPLPFTEEALAHVVPRIRQIQDFFEMPFAIENISYYAHPGEAEMSEWEFVGRAVEEANCSLLLDINNVYVNSVNHRFDPADYLAAMPYEKVIQIHVAGHREFQDFLLDNHGAAVIDPVWDLLAKIRDKIAGATVILERDNNIPDLGELISEVQVAKGILAGGVS